ncbi:hypothetical protein Y032_0014g2285 [Ancylostoma ceylanicum]|uniref:Uncharacterized protein n=1 Tax=Ancylostoma ceylanicum TaxID=53326 RepID=A0A016VBH2_9BILA|nr:hypothetical protein Y032_0014g2285 [Ancylostoma ceylanicum]
MIVTSILNASLKIRRGKRVDTILASTVVRQSTNLPQTSGSTTSNGQFDSCYLRDFVRTALFYLFFIKGNFCETTQRPKIASFRDMGSIAESVKQDNPEYPGNAWRGRVNKWTGQRLFEKFG